MNILLPVDGSEYSLHAVHQVISMKDLYRDPISVHLLNVQAQIISGGDAAAGSGEGMLLQAMPGCVDRGSPAGKESYLTSNTGTSVS